MYLNDKEGPYKIIIAVVAVVVLRTDALNLARLTRAHAYIESIFSKSAT